MSRRLLAVVAAGLLCTGVLHVPAGSGQNPTRAAARVVHHFKAGDGDASHDTLRFLLGPGVVTDAKDRSIRLARSVLLADEIGATDFHQTEALSDRVQVKKVFVLDSPEATGAELFFYGSAREVRLNGKLLSPPQRLASTGWSRVQVAPELLKAGENALTFRGGGSLLLQPGRAGRSHKSTDGGRSWSNRALGKDGEQQGEYLIRLRLGRYAAEGQAVSQVFDLWTRKTGEIGTPGKVVAFKGLAALTRNQPDGTRLGIALRTGSTPTPDLQHWTAWQPLDKDHRSEGSAQAHRWAQLRFVLRTSRPQATPRVPAAFALAFDFEPEAIPNAGKLVIARTGATPAPRIGATRFVYQGPSPRLKLLRERYQLDAVIAPGKTEMEQLMLLRTWVRNQWHTAWGSNAAAWMPPWDALVILENRDRPDCLTMCTHYAAVFTQCCLALGWNARHCILDHHCVAEVYVNQHDKWIMMDAGNSAQRADVGLHFERGDVPLSALELHQAQRSGKTEGITVHFTPARLAAKIAALCRPAPAKLLPPRPDVIALAELGKYPVCGLNNYRRYAFPPRNNYLSSLLPGELYQGWSEYFYDGYCWVGDSPDAPRIAPEYSRALSPARPQDIDWSLNWCRVHLSRTKVGGELRVDVETHTPNLARLEKRVGGKGAWQPTAASFGWQVRHGENELEVRSVNQWGKAGGAARARVEWTAGG